MTIVLPPHFEVPVPVPILDYPIGNACRRPELPPWSSNPAVLKYSTCMSTVVVLAPYQIMYVYLVAIELSLCH